VLIRRFKHKRQFKNYLLGAGRIFPGVKPEVRNGGLWLPKGGKGRGGRNWKEGRFGEESKEFGGEVKKEGLVLGKGKEFGGFWFKV